MHESGDFVDIRFQERTRYKKPVGIYWLQAVATAPFGGADAPLWAFRLPSLLGAIASVFAVWADGARSSTGAPGFSPRCSSRPSC